MSLSEAQFHQLVDGVQSNIEDQFDASDLDVDLINSGGILTIVFENGSQLIVSRQEPLKQIWVAARSGGFHFDYDPQQQHWFCLSNQLELGAFLSQASQEQAGEVIKFNAL